MAKRPNIPKFGDWKNQDQPFTVVFDNARINKQHGLYENLGKPETKTQEEAPPPPRPQSNYERPEPPRVVIREDTPRETPLADKAKVRAPPADQLYGDGGLYGRQGGGGTVGNQRPPQAPRPVQPKYTPRAGNNGRVATTIPPFPGSVGSGDDLSYTHIFDQVKEERNQVGGRSYGSTSSNTPAQPINGSKPKSSKICCFPWF